MQRWATAFAAKSVPALKEFQQSPGYSRKQPVQPGRDVSDKSVELRCLMQWLFSFSIKS